MVARHPNARQQSVLDAFDGGERNPVELGRRFNYTRVAVRNLLKRYGRKPRDRAEASLDPERRKRHSDFMKSVWAVVKAQQSA